MSTQPLRLDVPLHAILKDPASRPKPHPLPELQEFPEPIFPQHPELLGEDHPLDHSVDPCSGRRHWRIPQILHYMNGWLFPYVKSRIVPGEFHPIIAYLFTEWNSFAESDTSEARADDTSSRDSCLLVGSF